MDGRVRATGSVLGAHTRTVSTQGRGLDAPSTAERPWHRQPCAREGGRATPEAVPGAHGAGLGKGTAFWEVQRGVDKMGRDDRGSDPGYRPRAPGSELMEGEAPEQRPLTGHRMSSCNMPGVSRMLGAVGLGVTGSEEQGDLWAGPPS